MDGCTDRGRTTGVRGIGEKIRFLIGSDNREQLTTRNDRSLSGLPVRCGAWQRGMLLRGSFDRVVWSEPLAFAVDAVIRYGISMGARWLVREPLGRTVTVSAARTSGGE
jgi:hypothetical protein